MYKISTSKLMISRHYLPKEQGKEQKIHSHQYKVCIMLSGKKLDDNGFLVDIIEIKKILSAVLKRFSDVTLNDLPEFKDKSASIENLSKIIWDKFTGLLNAPNIDTVEIRIYENDNNWSSYSGEF